ncbi:hypothetical protein Q2K19_10610 [Micromonospora soli]|uniref:hypothetical protein n=1 Tax=Micromonospora sp. NBRC 110009 TaxID=3061627 RepID=UPI002671FB01|nr:hypothetical protein [Micromonospora sp. NBRC 110009]WKU00889.1 hypothetical protein Q2K19_10610 [Micromonospora sp. NBRC 110009]
MAMWRCPECGKSLIVPEAEREAQLAAGRGICVEDTVVVKGRVVVAGGKPVTVEPKKLQGWHKRCLDVDTARLNEELRKAAEEARARVVAEAEAVLAAARDGRE